LNNEYLNQFFPDHKVLWMTLKQLCKIFIKLSHLIATEQSAYCSRGKINFWSHLGEDRPGKPQKFNRKPYRGRIDLIESAGKRSEKVTLTTCPDKFSWNTFFMSNLYSKEYYFTGKSIKDQSSTFATFVRLLLLSPTRISPANYRVVLTCYDVQIVTQCCSVHAVALSWRKMKDHERSRRKITKDPKNNILKPNACWLHAHTTIPTNMIGSESKVHCGSAVRFDQDSADYLCFWVWFATPPHS